MKIAFAWSKRILYSLSYALVTTTPFPNLQLPLLILFSGVGERGSTYSCSESSELEEYVVDASPER